MKKDVIYIDIEDDITSIIGKVKDAKASIVALVPPKRIGVLQSVVNLKLLQRAASSVDKRVVLISGDHALTSLAAGVKIPVAKTLQSKPELAQIDALEIDDNDVIDGRDMPASEGTHIDLSEVNDADDEKVASLASASIAASQIAKPSALASAKKNFMKNGPKKIPDFMRFRKKAFIIGGALVVLGLVWWWAFFIAPSAKITITANTVLQNINENATLDSAVSTNAAQGIIKVSYQQVKKSVSVDFAATGKKDIGEKATGTMNINRSGVSDSSTTIPAGTGFSSGNFTFVTNAAVVVPRSQIVGSTIDRGSATVAVTATVLGPEYNLSARSYQSSVDGFTGQGSAMTGGSKQTVDVVTQDDIEKAKAQLEAQDQNAVKSDLTKQFGSGFQVIQESFKAVQGDAVSSPLVGEQATQAKLTAESNYTLAGISDTDLKAVLEDYAKKAIKDTSKQSVFDNGFEVVSLTKFQYLESGKATVNIATSAYLGPKIDKEQLKKDLVGKRYGDIQQIVKEIPNVDQVDIAFSPFWVTNAPGADKITIEFSVKQQN